MDEINSNEEYAAADATNDNIKRNNSKPANSTGVDQDYQEPINIPPITSTFEVIQT